MRSWLFVPADSERKIARALTSDADAVILDLEDSVAPDRKPAARECLRDCLGDKGRGGAKGPQIYIRVNPLDSGMTEADLDTAMALAPAGIMLPKCRDNADVERLDTLMSARDAGTQNARIIAIATETAASLFHMGSYEKAGPRLAGLCWGAEDLSADLGAQSAMDGQGAYTGPYRLARTLCLLAARAAGVQPIDGVHVNYRDMTGLRDECTAAMRDGFTGKLAIHPAQVEVINAVFTPSPEELARARRIVEAFAGGGNAGVIGLDGQMLDRPHLLRAQHLLERAARYKGAF